MLPGLAVDGSAPAHARREPLNAVSNTAAGRVHGVPGAMHKLASEKAARKAKNSAVALLSGGAGGALAAVSAQGAVDLKMPPLPPGTICG
jgi:hypothetical protein